MENSTELFQMALGISDPWYITSVHFEEQNGIKELHINISFKRGSKFQGNDGQSYTAHSTVERSWKHLNFFEHQCFLHARIPRIRYDDKVKTIAVPWARKGSGFTLLFEAFSMMLIENEMPVSKVAEMVDVNPQRIWNVFSHWISKAHADDEIGELSKIGFDETSSKKGHNYITTAVDMTTRRVLYATEGKGATCINKAVKYFKSKSVNCSHIEHVCIDMSPAFISGCSEYLPDSTITFDKFHIVKEVNNAMDELRRLERKDHDILKGHRYTFLKQKLSSAKFIEREYLMELYPRLGEGYRLQQLLKDFWDIKETENAESYLAYWCDSVKDSGIYPFIKVANMIKAHWSGVINYIESRITNGILEGINSKIQLVKKRARGYRKISNFISMIYFTCGKLKIDYQPKST